MEQSLALCRAAVAAGTRTIVATPHVNWDYPEVDGAAVYNGVVEVNRALQAADIDLRILPGAEVALSRASELSDGELGGLRLGGGPFLLIECSPLFSASGLEHALHRLAKRGHRIVFAHPERSLAPSGALSVVRALADAGMLCCVSSGSLTGRHGRQARAVAWDLLGSGLAHVIASDAHDAAQRPPDLAQELARAGLESFQIDHFACRVPQAIVEGSPLPSPPPIVTRRGRLARSRLRKLLRVQ
jgi:protein-tyrosine phosphatase